MVVVNKYYLASVLLNRLNDKNIKPLKYCEFQVTSQNGEDGIVFEIVKRINNDVSTGTFVEFGIEDGSEGNCVFLADWLNWNGLFIEYDENKYSMLNSKYSINNKIKTINKKVTSENINSLISSFYNEIDIISIDVDGNDFWIFKSLDFMPKIIITEYNASLGLEKKSLKEDNNNYWDHSATFGASITAFVSLAKNKGYTLVHTDLAGVNAFFVRNDLVHLFPESEQPIIHGTNYSLSSGNHGKINYSKMIDV